MDAWRYRIYLLVFTFDISLVRCAHSFDIDVNTRRQIPYLRATMYYSLFVQLGYPAITNIFVVNQIIRYYEDPAITNIFFRYRDTSL